jgi:hypothetical protein
MRKTLGRKVQVQIFGYRSYELHKIQRYDQAREDVTDKTSETSTYVKNGAFDERNLGMILYILPANGRAPMIFIDTTLNMSLRETGRG